MIMLTLFGTFWLCSTITNLGTVALFKAIDFGVPLKQISSAHPDCCDCEDPALHTQALREIETYLNSN